ncbi:hypothetical protein [Robiginitalea sp. SC105]|nr:hypothetical protein [Robiginitalea sp. SC105]MBC2838531.1 hypothetical protein [Robiginitalea sp. SC105]
MWRTIRIFSALAVAIFLLLVKLDVRRRTQLMEKARALNLIPKPYPPV